MKFKKEDQSLDASVLLRTYSKITKGRIEGGRLPRRERKGRGKRWRQDNVFEMRERYGALVRKLNRNMSQWGMGNWSSHWNVPVAGELSGSQVPMEMTLAEIPNKEQIVSVKTVDRHGPQLRDGVTHPLQKV